MTTPIKASDFDNWTEQDAEEAIKELAAKAGEFQWLIRGDKFCARFPDGKQIQVPLSIKSKIFLDVTEKAKLQYDDEGNLTSEGLTDVEQFKLLLASLGDEKSIEILEEQDMVTLGRVIKKFLDIFGKIQQVSLGEL